MPKTADDTITLIPVTQLRPHPKNPRVALREDVVDAIAVDLDERGHMEARHALTVRAVDDGYEIISGHHRHAAAGKAGLEGVPCWVVEMNDDEAYMALATSNNQGELAPLEIGLHALERVSRPESGRAKKGGLRDYARKVGKDEANVRRYRDGAEVYRGVEKCGIDTALLREKAQHLHAIHAADKSLWPVIVPHMLKLRPHPSGPPKAWSVADTEHWVGKASEFEEPEGCSKWLPLTATVERFLDTKEFSAQTVRKLGEERNAIMDVINENRDAIEAAGQLAKGWMDEVERWLEKNMGGKSWDVRELVAYRLEIEQRILKSGPNQWLHGNWRDHVGAIKDGSIAVLLTDPPYGMDYQSNYRLDTRKSKKHDKIANDGLLDGPGELHECLSAFDDKLTTDAHVFVFCHWRNEQEMRDAIVDAGFSIKGSLIWAKNNTGMGDLKGAFAPKHERIIHAVKGSPILFEREADVLEYDRVNTDRHPTEKPVDLLARLIEITSVKGQRIADPFAGVGSTCEAAASIGRLYWGCELKEEYYEHGQARLNGLEPVGS